MDALDLKEVLEGLDIEEISAQVVQDNSEIIADLNAGQLAQGIRADSKPILPEYSPLTVQLKKEKSGLSAVTDHVTLFDKGDFYKGLEVLVKGTEIDYGSNDPKSGKLQTKYGDQIFGLTEDSADELSEGFLRPGIIDKIEQKTGLVFSE